MIAKQLLIKELELAKRNSCCGCPLGYKNASVWYLQQKHVEKITEEGFEALKNSKKADTKGRYVDDVDEFANIYRVMLANQGIGEWGYSALVEVDGRKILFDTGRRPETVLQNAEELGIEHQVQEYYTSKGIKWYHYVPYFMIKDPLFLFKKYFWKRSFLENNYEAKFDFKKLQLEDLSL